MKLLLIDPPSNHKAPNVGLLYLACALKGSNHEAFLFNAASYPVDNPAERILEIMQRYEISHLGFSISDVNHQTTLDIVRAIKAKREAIVIFGGAQVNSIKADILAESEAVDYALSGESERSIFDLLDFLEGRKAAGEVAGLIHRSEANGRVFSHPPVYHKTLDDLPMPDLSLLGIDKLKGYMLLTSRGCPYRCIFCARNTGTRWLPRKIDDCIEELKHQQTKHGVETFRVIDATFNMTENRVVDFCRAYQESGLALPWMVSGIRADRLTRKSVEALKEAGCLMLAMGIESIDPEVFKNINKGETLEEIEAAILLCKEAGLEIAAYMIHGLPGDGYKRSIHYARRLQRMKVDYAMYNQVVPFRGTALYDWALEHAHVNQDFNWLHTRDMQRVAYWEESFPEQERIESFKIIQTITRVINYTGHDPNEFDERIAEIKKHDPAHLDEHIAYMREIQEQYPKKNLIRRLHKETDFTFKEGYTGLVDIQTGELL